MNRGSKTPTQGGVAEVDDKTSKTKSGWHWSGELGLADHTSTGIIPGGRYDRLYDAHPSDGCATKFMTAGLF